MVVSVFRVVYSVLGVIMVVVWVVEEVELDIGVVVVVFCVVEKAAFSSSSGFVINIFPLLFIFLSFSSLFLVLVSVRLPS